MHCIFACLKKSPFCGEHQYKIVRKAGKKKKQVPHRQFATIPIGPQLQALWRSPESATNLCDRIGCTEKHLTERQSPEGIQTYDDVCCGSNYLDLIESRKINENDMILSFSIDGVQLYPDKKSDTWFGVFIVLDFTPELQFKKDAVLPTVIIPGPNPLKHPDSFLFPTFSHLAACQHLSLKIWESINRTVYKSVPWTLFFGADTVRMALLNGWVGHHGQNGCRLSCPMRGQHKRGCATYYPVLLKPHGPLPADSGHPDIDINSINLPEVKEYNECLALVLASSSQNQYKQQCEETGISKLSLLSGLPKSIPVPKCFPADTMHLFGLNIPALLMDLW